MPFLVAQEQHNLGGGPEDPEELLAREAVCYVMLCLPCPCREDVQPDNHLPLRSAPAQFQEHVQAKATAAALAQRGGEHRQHARGAGLRGLGAGYLQTLSQVVADTPFSSLSPTCFQGEKRGTEGILCHSTIDLAAWLKSGLRANHWVSSIVRLGEEVQSPCRHVVIVAAPILSRQVLLESQID